MFIGVGGMVCDQVVWSVLKPCARNGVVTYGHFTHKAEGP